MVSTNNFCQQTNTEKLEIKMGVVGKKRTEMITTDKEQCKR